MVIPYWPMTLASLIHISEEAHEATRLDASEAQESKRVEAHQRSRHKHSIV
jgi:hypothetical protein